MSDVFIMPEKNEMNKEKIDNSAYSNHEGIAYSDHLGNSYGFSDGFDDGFGKGSSQSILLQTIVEIDGETNEGVIIKAVTIPWIEISKLAVEDPNFLDSFAKHPRKFEEFLAGCYQQAGYEDVVLTPSSGDLGIDIIISARLPGAGTIRIVDQAKAFTPPNVVKASDVRELAGVLARDTHTTHKGIITTTSKFAPGVYDEYAEMIPNRLILKDRTQLIDWIRDLMSSSDN